MKIIFSRKGFDSEYGGVPSPIMPDGRPISLPIPTEYGPTRYRDIHTAAGNLGDLVQHLSRGRIAHDAPVHLDPDLDANYLTRASGWLPTFGQELAAQSHLASQGVHRGDIFLFFGWFRPTELHEGVLRYVPGAPGVHQIFGWLQIADVLHIGHDLDGARARHPGISRHPHLHRHAGPMNTIYTARDRLFLDTETTIPGGGFIAQARDAHQLTDPRQHRRSLWRLPDCLHPIHGRTMTYHGKPERWTTPTDGYCTLQSVAKGQEFVYDTQYDPAIMQWLHALLSPTPIQDTPP